MSEPSRRKVPSYEISSNEALKSDVLGSANYEALNYEVLKAAEEEPNEASKATPREEARLRLTQNRDTFQSLLKDARNVTHHAQLLSTQAQALREAGQRRRGDHPLPLVAGLPPLAGPPLLAGLLPVAGLPRQAAFSSVPTFLLEASLEPLPGTVCSQFIRCGKPICHCQHGARHGPYFYRLWRDSDGVQKKYVPLAKVAEVRAQCALYPAFQRELRRLVRERDRLWRKMIRRKPWLEQALRSLDAA